MVKTEGDLGQRGVDVGQGQCGQTIEPSGVIDRKVATVLVAGRACERGRPFRTTLPGLSPTSPRTASHCGPSRPAPREETVSRQWGGLGLRGLGRRPGLQATPAACSGSGRRSELRRSAASDRARRRQRLGLDAHPRPPRRRRLCAQRLDNVDHQRHLRPRRRDLGQTRGFAVPTVTPASPREIPRKLFLRASVTAELALDDVRLPGNAVCPA